MQDHTLIINTAADLDAVPYVQRTPAWLADFSNEIYLSLIQSAAIHPGWTVDTVASYLVNDEFQDPSEIVSMLRNTGYTLAQMWDLAKGRAAHFAEVDQARGNDLIVWPQPDGMVGRIEADDIRALVGYTSR